MNLNTSCSTCRTPIKNNEYQCGICKEQLCKKCSLFLSENFNYYRKIPAVLTHATYCSCCYDAQVAQEVDKFNDILEKSLDIIIFTKDESKRTRLINRKEAPYFVDNCLDEDDALKRMSFWAAEDGFNCLVDIVYKKTKIVVGSHKKFIWSATSIPVKIDTNRFK